MNENSLNTKLNRIDTAISNIRTKLNLEENAPIENIAESIDLEKLVNLFIQEEEPEIKEGIWIPATDLTIDKKIIDEYLYVGDTWLDPSLIGKVHNSTGSGDMSSAIVGNYLYLCGAISSNTNMYKVNLTDYTVTQGAKPPVPLCGKEALVVGTDIYYIGNRTPYSLSGKQDLIKYDTVNNIFTTEYTFNETFNDYAKFIYYNGYIYMFCIPEPNYSTLGVYSNSRCIKYNITEKTITVLPNYPKWYCGMGEPILLGNKVWFLFTADYNSSASSTVPSTAFRKTRIFDLETEQFIETNLEFDSSLNSGSSANCPRPVLIGNMAFLWTPLGLYELPIDKLVFSNTLTKINTSELVKHDLPDNIGNNSSYISVNSVTHDNKNIYISGFQYATDYDVLAFSFKSKEYDDNTLIIRQGISNASAVLTQLFNIELGWGRLTYPVYDVAHYTSKDGLNNSFPVYYGNGTEWIKFKN